MNPCLQKPFVTIFEARVPGVLSKVSAQSTHESIYPIPRLAVGALAVSQ